MDDNRFPERRFRRESSKDNFSLRKVLQKYTQRKRLFIISITICLLIAAAYCWIKNPLYNIYATVVIKDQKKGETTNIALKELDFFDEQKIVDNESEIIKSENLVHKVVEKLALHIGYAVRENNLLYSPLYYDPPLELIWITAPEKTPVSFDVLIKTDSTAILKDGDQSFQWGDTLNINGAICALRSTPVTEKYLNKNIRVTYNTVQATVQQLRDDIIISQASKNSSVLNIVMLYPSPQKGQDVLNKLLDEYTYANAADKKKQTDSTLEFIDSRIERIFSELGNLETTEERFKTTHKITALGADAQLFLDKVKENDIRLKEAGIQMELLNAVETHITDHKDMIAPPAAGLADPVLTAMVGQLRDLLLQKEELSKKVGAQNAALKAKTNQIEEVRGSIVRNIQTQKLGLQQSIKQLSSEKNRIDNQISAVPANERNLTGIVREKNIRENIYTYLLQKREEASITGASAFSSMRLVDSAYSSAKPVKPNKLLTLFTALFAGLILPVFFINVQPLLLHNVNSKQDITSNTSIPIIGTVGAVKRGMAIGFENREPDLSAEQFRVLRNSIQRFNIDKQPIVILVSSAGKNEGKHFVSEHLALSLALSQNKTVLVDMNIRVPEENPPAGTENNPGISGYLLNATIDPANIISSTGNPYLDKISAGAYQRSVLDLLKSSRMSGLVDELKKSYRYIILKTSPSLATGDAFQLEYLTDLNLFIVRHSMTSLNNLEYLEQLYLSGAFKNMFLIYNSVPAKALYDRKTLRQIKKRQYL